MSNAAYSHRGCGRSGPERWTADLAEGDGTDPFAEQIGPGDRGPVPWWGWALVLWLPVGCLLALLVGAMLRRLGDGDRLPLLRVDLRRIRAADPRIRGRRGDDESTAA